MLPITFRRGAHHGGIANPGQSVASCVERTTTELTEAIRPPKTTSTTSSGEEEILAALQRRIALKDPDTTLRSIADQFRRQLEVHVVLAGDHRDPVSKKYVPLPEKVVKFGRLDFRAEVLLDHLAGEELQPGCWRSACAAPCRRIWSRRGSWRSG